MAKPIENNKKKYMEYVQKKLKKYKVNDPSKVPGKHKKKFFTELDKGWESKEEKKQKKEKKKSEVIAAVKVKLSKQANLEGHAVDWKKALERVTKAIISNLSTNNGSGVKSQVEILRKSCDNLDALVDDFSKESVNKIAPKQPPKGWWDKMQKTIENKNPDLSEAQVSKIVGGIWYSRMSPEKKKEVTEEFES